MQLLNQVNNSIRDQYPGTKMAITEYEYDRHDHYSAGLAQADALSVFGSQGLYLATYSLPAHSRPCIWF